MRLFRVILAAAMLCAPASAAFAQPSDGLFKAQIGPRVRAPIPTICDSAPYYLDHYIDASQTRAILKNLCGREREVSCAVIRHTTPNCVSPPMLFCEWTENTCERFRAPPDPLR